ncbi:hypothetical protein QR680_012765 [Steinernema hermaphroditum]|uniref:Uncharacterized protein n=1 Tax=Steinernema hermaphroditum TaxID=289476 RepID=A0AA39I337_9BILA|nr:hypothetical protein QR680_012765 [Steinernema hermaphroditum]
MAINKRKSREEDVTAIRDDVSGDVEELLRAGSARGANLEDSDRVVGQRVFWKDLLAPEATVHFLPAMSSEVILAELERIRARMDDFERRLGALEAQKKVILQKSYDGASGEVVSAAVEAPKKTPVGSRRSLLKTALGRRTSGGAAFRKTRAPPPPNKPPVNRFLLVGAESSAKWSLLRQMLSLCERFPSKFQRCDALWTPQSISFPRDALVSLRLGILRSALRILGHISRHQIPFSSSKVSKIAAELLEASDDDAETIDLRATRSRLAAVVHDPNFREVLTQNEHRWSLDGGTRFLTEVGITKIFDDSKDVTWGDVAESNLEIEGNCAFFFKIRDHRFQITVIDSVDVDDLPGAIDSWIKANSAVRNSRIHVLYAASLFDVALPLLSSPSASHFDLTLAHFSRCLKSTRLQRSCSLLIYFTNKHRLEAKLHQNPIFRETCATLLGKKAEHEKNMKIDHFLTAYASRFSERISAAARFDKNVYHRFTSTSDEQILDGLLAAVKDQIISDSLSESALF